MTLHIGFLFNHDALHQISHLAPMVPALAASGRDVKISVLASSKAQLDYVKHLTGPVKGVDFKVLGTPGIYDVLDRFMGKIAPFRRVAVLKTNLDIFKGLDVLVVPERTSLLLRQRFGLDHLKFVRICHGAGDRDVAWSANIAEFDYVMLPGAKHRNRMLELGLVREENSAVIGYMKFDALSHGGTPPRLFNNDKPVVLYNPHFDPYLSSWYEMGEKVLDYFAGQSDFNLVFAPHVMLMQRRLHTSIPKRLVRWRRDLDERFHKAENILIDTGSHACMDMTYVRAADIYLGDVSSQVYEFIAKPRPCIFLNAHGADWQNDPQYRFWSMGAVASTIEELDRHLKNAAADFERYRPVQEELFNASIDMQDEPSAVRAVDALLTYLDQKGPEYGIEKAAVQHY